jgi:hypothetical protein
MNISSLLSFENFFEPGDSRPIEHEHFFDVIFQTRAIVWAARPTMMRSVLPL